MPTQLRQFKSGAEFHIFGRGHHRSSIFKRDSDRVHFLTKLDEFCDRDQITLFAYCLMTNHYHLALRQDGTVPLSNMMSSLLSSYVQRYNSRYGTPGRLFQGRYQSVLITSEHHLACETRYIHQNPRKFTDFRTYRWSSYQQYVDTAPGIADATTVLALFDHSRRAYANFCEENLPAHLQR
ncbi:MAG: hypothetical protein K0S68_547 [Candidatus Saccharibacteria bacterium]|jgi:REP element-mobilizing transposase RayT|nr:hypothetical protein [Candidatus Saccharibacteria bacterium]